MYFWTSLKPSSLLAACQVGDLSYLLVQSTDNFFSGMPEMREIAFQLTHHYPAMFCNTGKGELILKLLNIFNYIQP